MTDLASMASKYRNESRLSSKKSSSISVLLPEVVMGPSVGALISGAWKLYAENLTISISQMI